MTCGGGGHGRGVVYHFGDRGFRRAVLGGMKDRRTRGEGPGYNEYCSWREGSSFSKAVMVKKIEVGWDAKISVGPPGKKVNPAAT